MYFSKPPYIIYRNYPNFGYITDNRNYGYDTATKSCMKVGERILSPIGSVFYSMLSYRPITLSEISTKLSQVFLETPIKELENDAKKFFLELSRDGFVYCSNSFEPISMTKYFSYNNTNPAIVSEVENHDNIDTIYPNWFKEYNLLRLHLCITNSCNERCIHCYYPSHNIGEFMSKELFLNIIEQCKELNVLNITLSGGEPLMNPNLAFFIKKCREYNFSINLLSNLTLLTPSLIKEIQNTPLISVQTSLYSMDEKCHDSITTIKGSFIKTKKAIEILHSLDIPMQINCPIMKQNKETYKEVIEWAKVLNIEASSDYLLFGCYDGSSKNLSCRLELYEVETILKKEQKNENNPNISKSEILSYDSICPVCYSSLCVSPTGKIYPCEGWQSYILGNINKTTLSEIWKNSLDIKKLRNLTLNDFPKCNDCVDREFCSICLIRNVNESKSLDYMDVNPYFCSIAKIKRKIASRN